MSPEALTVTGVVEQILDHAERGRWASLWLETPSVAARPIA